MLSIEICIYVKIVSEGGYLIIRGGSGTDSV